MTVAVESEQTIFTGFHTLNLDAEPIVKLPESADILPELEINRLLTEVEHIASALSESADVPEVIRQDVTVNLKTSLAELSMPYAVTQTAHKIERLWSAEEQREMRTFQWLGRCAVGVAESGYDFHISEPARKRVDVEVEEAKHAQETLKPGKMQFFVSPRMSRQDAPEVVAKQEHLHEEDSVRASFLVVDSEGNESHRIMESLLVKDVPLKAWVNMLRDPGNIFGKSIGINDEGSALSVMETFQELELDEEQAPEGPVTLIEAVVPYIEDDLQRLNVQLQLGEFRKDQQLYKERSEQFATEWYDFDLELAQSLQKGVTTERVTKFISSIESSLADNVRANFESYRNEEGYAATRHLIALTEKAKRNILATKAGIATGNEHILEQVDKPTIEAVQTITENYGNPALAKQIEDVDRSIVKQSVETNGGCSGSACGLDAVKEGAADAYINKLGGEKGDKVAKDKVRTCECGAKSIVYVYNNAKVIKHCESCRETEVTYTKRKAA